MATGVTADDVHVSDCTNTSLVPPQVKEELLVEALTKRKTVTVNDKLILPYSHSEVGAQRYHMLYDCYCS